jgi:hypothetical protein
MVWARGTKRGRGLTGPVGQQSAPAPPSFKRVAFSSSRLPVKTCRRERAAALADCRRRPRRRVDIAPACLLRTGAAALIQLSLGRPALPTFTAHAQ